MGNTFPTSIRLTNANQAVIDRIAASSGESKSIVINHLILDAANNLYTGGLVKLMRTYKEETGRDPLDDQEGFNSFKNGIEQNRCPSGFFAEMVKDGYMAKITTRIK